MTLDRKYKPDKEPPEATSGAKVPNKPKTPSDSGSSKVTTGKAEQKKETQSGGESETTPKKKSIRRGSQYVERPKKKEEPKPDPVTASKGGKSEGDTDKIRIGASGRQMRVTGGSDPVPIKRGKEGKRRGRPPGSANKPKPEVPGQQTIPGLGSKVGDAAKKVGSKVGDAAKDTAKKVGSKVGDIAKDTAKKAGDGLKSGAKKAGEAIKDKAVKVGKGVKDEVVSGTKELSKNIEKKVAAGKEKRDASRKATKVKVTTNYTKPKKGEEMKVPEKKDKVTVNTSKDTTKKRETQKKKAPAALAQAVANRTEADAAKDAVSDMKKSGNMGKVTDCLLYTSPSPRD